MPLQYLRCHRIPYCSLMLFTFRHFIITETGRLSGYGSSRQRPSERQLPDTVPTITIYRLSRSRQNTARTQKRGLRGTVMPVSTFLSAHLRQ